MRTSPDLLCAYCGVSPSLPGDVYCCAGCRVLAEVTHSPAPPSLDPAPDDPALTLNFGREEGGKTRFQCHVDPLACEACLQGLSRLDQLIPGLEDLQWNRRHSILSFRFARGRERPNRAFQLLKELQLSPRWRSPQEGQPVQNDRRRSLRIGVTAGITGNLMLFSVPIYAGLAGDLRIVFEWIQGVLFLPVLFWSALPFYRTAWVSFRLRQLSVDLPLTIAFLSTSIYSYIALALGRHDVYFDSLAGFLFLILWSRSLLEDSLARYLETPPLERFFENPLFDVERDGEKHRRPWKDIAEGDILLLQSGDRVPADGLLLNPGAEVESAWMTGEKLPFWRLRGSMVLAGSRLVSKEARLKVVRTAEETDFAALLKRLRQPGEKIASRPEARLGAMLVIACMTAILGLAFFADSLGSAEIVRRAIALLIVACPCAVSFAAPLARARANRLAFQTGFWIQNDDVWGRLTRVKKIAFDKTGTLTGGGFSLDPHTPLIDDHWKRIILSLENDSHHPIAESLRRSWGVLPLSEVEDRREIIGQGVSGRIHGVSYEVRGAAIDDGPLTVELLREGERVVSLRLQDAATEATENTLRRLHGRYELFIVSGDRPSRVDRFGRQHGFKTENLHGGLSPERKAFLLERIQPDVYVGDGTNDVPAMKSTPVSVGLASGSLEAQAASDIIMLDNDFSRCEKLFAIARETRTLNRRNFAFALAYNLGAGAAALLGWIQPLEAAVLMPLSSFLLLGSTLWGTTGLRGLGRKI